MKAMKAVGKPVMKWAALRAIVGRNRSRHAPEKGRFTSAEVRRILDECWRNFDECAPRVPRQPTVGSRMNLLLACVTLSFFRALTAAGVERGYAIELFADTAWRVYEKWGILPRCATRLLSRDPAERMRLRVNMFLRFPFNQPGYEFKRLPLRDGISVEMRRCPVAEYFRFEGASDLCVGSWCNLDYALAEMWGGRLERTETLAGGAAHCDFRFRAARPQTLSEGAGVSHVPPGKAQQTMEVP